MPRLSHATPKYRKHKASGQAFVELNGKRIYLGPHGTKASQHEYDRLIGEWLINGRRSSWSEESSEATVADVIVAYLKFAKSYYVKHNKPTREYELLRETCRIIRPLYGQTPAVEFGPLALKVVRQKMIDAGHCRGFINKNIGRIKRMFKWAAEEEIIPGHVAQSLWTVSGLKRGRTEARESKPVLPVDDTIVDATLEHLPQVVADMVHVQRLTGCRPAEVCSMRPSDLDRTQDVWTYRPTTHKTEHHGRERVVFIGERAQGILLYYLARHRTDYLFRPCDSEAKRRAAAHANRKTPMSCGNVPGSNRKTRRRRAPGNRYDVASYRRAIHRACDKAKVERWSPNQLRHSAATEIRKAFGLEAAQVVLGHASASITQVYAERDYSLAANVARQIG